MKAKWRNHWFELQESVRIAASQISANRTRSILTALGVIIGIIAVTLMGTAIRGIDTGFDRSMKMLGDDVLYLEQWPWTPTEDFWVYRNRPDIKISQVGRLNSIIGSTPNSLLVLAVPAPSMLQTVVAGKRQLTNVFLMGTTNEYTLVGDTDCKYGRFLNEPEARGGREVCVIGLDVAEALFGPVDPTDRIVKVSNHEFRVIGVFERQGSFLGLFSFDSQIVIPISTYQKYFKGNSEDVSIKVKVKDRTKLAEAYQELRGDFRRIRRLNPEQLDNFSINEQQAFRSTLGPIKTGLAIAGLFITGLALFVGAIGIMNITFVSVKERTREIGTRKALGARRRTILLQFLIEAVAICVVGGLVGLVLAYGLFALMAVSFPAFPVSFAPGLVVLALAISVLTGIVSGFAPAWQASRLDPVVALRYE